MSATKDAGLALVFPPNIYSFGKPSEEPAQRPQQPVKGRAYTFANPADVRRLANGAWIYTSTGKFAPTKNGRPLSLGFRKDKRGRVYNPEARAARARANFNIPEPELSAALTDAELEALAVKAPTMAPGTPAIGGRYLNTVARWADLWVGYLIYYDESDPAGTARIGESAPVSDELGPVVENMRELAERPRYLADNESAFPIIVPVRSA